MATLILDVRDSEVRDSAVPGRIAVASAISAHRPHEDADLRSVWGRLAQTWDELCRSRAARGPSRVALPPSAFSTGRE